MPDHTHLFVAGLHRSGTSMLTRALAAHPEASAFSATGFPEDEGQFLQHVFPIAKIYGGPGRFGFHPESHLTERSPLATAENAERLRSQWSRHWDLSKRVLIEKSPPNLLKLRFLQRMFPAAAFVVVIRHPIAVALATQKWSLTPLHSLVRHWLACHERFLEDAGSIDRLFLTSYEALVADPEIVVEIQELAGMAPHGTGLEPRLGINDAYFNRWRSGEGVLAKHYRSAIARVFEARVNRFGYSLTAPWQPVEPDDRVASLLARRATPLPRALA